MAPGQVCANLTKMTKYAKIKSLARERGAANKWLPPFIIGRCSMRLKSVRIRKLADGDYVVTPEYYGRRGRTVRRTRDRLVGRLWADLVQAVVAAARKLR